jgi:ABC-type Mn2+/Zn2+ transport system ATPase subunit
MKPVSALTLHDITAAYDAEPVLAHVSLEIAAGEFVGVVGPNGAGKSTLLNAILGIMPIVRGEVYTACRSRKCARTWHTCRNERR